TRTDESDAVTPGAQGRLDRQFGPHPTPSPSPSPVRLEIVPPRSTAPSATTMALPGAEPASDSDLRSTQEATLTNDLATQNAEINSIRPTPVGRLDVRELLSTDVEPTLKEANPVEPQSAADRSAAIQSERRTSPGSEVVGSARSSLVLRMLPQGPRVLLRVLVVIGLATAGTLLWRPWASHSRATESIAVIPSPIVRVTVSRAG